ncbi:hypothetical protein BDV29DRAFT_6185 [Aspergillus leporis]|uniref:Uncharacterized protein n=1 Tax=Aspergillus leporis TaxID=41062 RepID=A0A5N5WYQ7_9EURO|nr:hypothetical protein BDV29DRAFT_6185 [Aspergillus leporis]
MLKTRQSYESRGFMIGTAGSASHIGGQWWLFFRRYGCKRGREAPSSIGGHRKEREFSIFVLHNHQTLTTIDCLSSINGRFLPVVIHLPTAKCLE